jgi:predicted ATPase/DNA-binding CsgD family transcriptional regulator
MARRGRDQAGIELSPREQEVAALVTEGLTNREIGTRLFISVRTVEGHVEQILNKLGANRRSQIASWAQKEPTLRRPGNLPFRLSTFVGREEELDELRNLFFEARLVTIVGAGGMGKTRLALQVAPIVGGKDGPWFVDLAPLTSGDHIWDAIAAVVNPGAPPGGLLQESVLVYLSDRQSLILLDNCEHILDGASRAADALLRRCPRVQVLATSREPLGIEGETTWRAPSLRQPEALLLFNARAHRVQPSAPGMGPDPALADLVDRLDCMPLAIELAAAQVRSMTIPDILDHLDDRLRLLNRGDRLAAGRQQSLLATLNWSYDLLDGRQQVLFRRLAVFAGWFTFEEVQGVAGPEAERGDVLQTLLALVEKSMVLADVADRGSAHYRLLDTMRTFGLQLLVTLGELENLQQVHAAHFTEMAREVNRLLKGPEQWLWRERLDEALDDFRAALAWGLERDHLLAIRLAGRLWHFWLRSARLKEGGEWLDKALLAWPEKGADRALALTAAGHLANYEGNLVKALELLRSAVAMCREAGDLTGLMFALQVLGTAQLAGGDVKDGWHSTEEALALSQRLDDRWATAMLLNQMSALALVQDEIPRARTLIDRALPLLRKTGDAQLLPWLLDSLAEIQVTQGDLDGARAAWLEAIGVINLRYDRWSPAASLDGLGLIAALTGDSDRTLRLAAFAESFRARSGIAHHSQILDQLTEAVESARNELGEKQAARAWGEGWEMDLMDAVTLAQAAEPTSREGMAVPRSCRWANR